MDKRKHTTVYRCYSTKEHDFLASKGVEYIIKCRDIKTSAIMWLYDRNEELNELLNECKTLASSWGLIYFLRTEEFRYGG